LFLRFNRLFYTWSFEKDFEKLKLADFTSQSQINRLNWDFNRLFFEKHNKFCFNCQNCFGLICICFGLSLTKTNDYFCGFITGFWIFINTSIRLQKIALEFFKKIARLLYALPWSKEWNRSCVFLRVSGVTCSIHTCIFVYVWIL